MSEALDTPSAHSSASGNPDVAASAAAKPGSPLSRGRGVRNVLRTIALACVLLFLSAASWVWAIGPAPLGRDLEFSKQVLDRNGKLLRAYATTDGRWRLPAKVSDVDPRFFDVLFAYEDKRFRSHHGVDPLAVIRAGLQFATSGHLRSGASTLTMQVARLLEGRHPRDLPGKLDQMLRAIEIERALSKEEILNLYLELAPYGGNIEGIRAASLVYLGKEPRRLTLAEAALLVALPQSPEPRRPDHHWQAARAARDRVLDRFAETGKVPADEIALAKSAPVPTARHAMPLLAPHAADEASARDPTAHDIRLTIDASIQRTFEQLARERERALATSLGPNVSLAILVVDNASGQVLAHVGSPAYFDARRAGQVDMAAAVRSPGSTLKPFIYGMGFEDGFIHPETLIEDRPVSYGAYAPKDFDYGFKGTVSVREALQYSLNVPAVAVLDRVGPARLAARLTQAGAALTLPDGQAPGLAMGLGGVGIKLADLVKLYSGIARLGLAVPLREQLPLQSAADVSAPEARRLMEPAAAWYVGNVLLGVPPPENGVPGRIAFKTGTSYSYRDAWSVGFDGRHTIGVWVGRPDGAPVPGLIGREAAAPILFDAFARLGASSVPLPQAPAGVVFASNAKLPPPLRHFQPGRLAGATAQPPLRIMFPPDGARLDLSETDGKPDPVLLKVTGAVAPLTVLVNGVPVPDGDREGGSNALYFTPAGPGFSRVTVTDASGSAASVIVRVDEGAPSRLGAITPATGTTAR
jgi:penicillin-binding protein 1C